MQNLVENAKKIRLVILDVDGVLSTGSLMYKSDGTEIKLFHVHDGLGIKLLQKNGIDVAIITARQSEAVTKRMQDLQVQYVYQNHSDKVIPYEELKQKLNL